MTNKREFELPRWVFNAFVKISEELLPTERHDTRRWYCKERLREERIKVK